MSVAVYSDRDKAYIAQALVSFKKYMPPSLPYFKVNIYPFPLPHFASIFFGGGGGGVWLWFFVSFRIVLSDNTRVRILILFCQFFFQNITLGYMAKTLNQIIPPPPPPFKLNGPSLRYHFKCRL